MSNERNTLELIGLIYDAAGNPKRWSVFLERLGVLLESPATTLFVQDMRSHEASVAATAGYDSAYEESYRAYYAGRNIYLIRGAHLLRAGEVVLSEELCPDDIALRTEFYNDWIAPQKLGGGIMGFIQRDDSLTSMIGASRARNARILGPAEVSLLKTLMPHLQRAVALHQRITDLESRERAAADALNRWPLGVILFDAQGKVTLMNRAAEAILAANDGLRVTRDGLSAVQSDDTAMLRRMIRGAVRKETGVGPEGALLLPRPSLKRPLNLLISPACGNSALFSCPGAAAAVFVSDPESVPESDGQALARLFGLSPAEARVALLLMQGRSVEQVADNLCISRETARTHLKRMFHKTGTKRQGELIRLFLTSPAQLVGAQQKKFSANLKITQMGDD